MAFEETFWMMVNVILAIAIIGSNSLLLATLLTQKRLYNATNLFVISLSASDLLVGLIILPLLIIGELFKNKFSPSTTCHIYALFILFNCLSAVCSVYSILGIASERFRVIVQPLKPRFDRSQCMTAIVGFWVLAFLLSCIFLVQVESKNDLRFMRPQSTNFPSNILLFDSSEVYHPTTLNPYKQHIKDTRMPFFRENSSSSEFAESNEELLIPKHDHSNSYIKKREMIVDDDGIEFCTMTKKQNAAYVIFQLTLGCTIPLLTAMFLYIAMVKSLWKTRNYIDSPCSAQSSKSGHFNFQVIHHHHHYNCTATNGGSCLQKNCSSNNINQTKPNYKNYYKSFKKRNNNWINNVNPKDIVGNNNNNNSTKYQMNKLFVHRPYLNNNNSPKTSSSISNKRKKFCQIYSQSMEYMKQEGVQKKQKAFTFKKRKSVAERYPTLYTSLKNSQLVPCKQFKVDPREKGTEFHEIQEKKGKVRDEIDLMKEEIANNEYENSVSRKYRRLSAPSLLRDVVMASLSTVNDHKGKKGHGCYGEKISAKERPAMTNFSIMPLLILDQISVERSKKDKEPEGGPHHLRQLSSENSLTEEGEGHIFDIDNNSTNVMFKQERKNKEKSFTATSIPSTTHPSSVRVISRKNKRAIKLLICIMSMYMFCFLPFYILSLVELFYPLRIPKYIYNIHNVLTLTGHWANVLLYTYFSKSFRDGFKSMMLLHKCYPSSYHKRNHIEVNGRYSPNVIMQHSLVTTTFEATRNRASNLEEEIIPLTTIRNITLKFNRKHSIFSSLNSDHIFFKNDRKHSKMQNGVIPNSNNNNRTYFRRSSSPPYNPKVIVNNNLQNKNHLTD